MRRATPADRDAVLAFASATWDGWDYIPHAWPVWIEARDGMLLVGEPAEPGAVDADGEPLPPGRPVAVARVARTTPAEAWLEGIRVDPRVRGMDIATDLQVVELNAAASLGAKVVRYATGQHNEGSHRLGARHGFSVLASLRTWWSRADDDDEEDDDESAYDPQARARATEERRRLLAQLSRAGLVVPATGDDRLWATVERSQGFARAAGLYEHRAWALQALTGERFDDHLRRGEVVATGAPAENGWGVAIVPGEALPAEDVSLHLGLLCGEGLAAVTLAAEIDRHAENGIRFRLPDADAPIPGASRADLAAAGFTAREWLLDILGRPLGDGNPPPPVDPTAVVVDVPELAAVSR